MLIIQLKWSPLQPLVTVTVERRHFNPETLGTRNTKDKQMILQTASSGLLSLKLRSNQEQGLTRHCELYQSWPADCFELVLPVKPTEVVEVHNNTVNRESQQLHCGCQHWDNKLRTWLRKVLKRHWELNQLWHAIVLSCCCQSNWLKQTALYIEGPIWRAGLTLQE